jgi:hypothetical protein
MDEFDEVHVEPLSDAASRAAAAARMREAHSHVDEAIRQAVARGDFDDLPGTGKPLDLGDQHDPDWWLKKLVERERVAVLPPSIQLRKDDAALDDLLDRQTTEEGARQVVAEFNGRVLAARYSTPVGPPLITMPRDVEQTVEQWRARRAAQLATYTDAVAADAKTVGSSTRRTARRGPLPTVFRRLLGRRTHE